MPVPTEETVEPVHEPLTLGPGSFYVGWDYCPEPQCWRAHDHRGRHAEIDFQGRVEKVWGRDEYYDTRQVNTFYRELYEHRATLTEHGF